MDFDKGVFDEGILNNKQPFLLLQREGPRRRHLRQGPLRDQPGATDDRHHPRLLQENHGLLLPRKERRQQQRGQLRGRLGPEGQKEERRQQEQEGNVRSGQLLRRVASQQGRCGGDESPGSTG